jgi:hypothetical protein
LFLGVMLAWALGGSAPAADKSKLNVDGVKIGSTMMGPKWTEADLKNKVVVMEFWGIN